MKNYKIAITTGDKNGIGLELVEKSLNFLNLKKEDVLIIGEKIFTNSNDSSNTDYLMGYTVDYNTNETSYDTVEINEVDNGTFCYKSLEYACELARLGVIKGIVTSPVSKDELNKSGYNFSGQTEILEYFLAPNSKKAQMLFIANKLRVMLLTRHCALNQIKLNIDDIVFQVQILNDFLKEKCNIENPKIALCALNPHCGENGLLGREEIEILEPAVKILNEKEINVTHPLSADGLFGKIGREYLNGQELSYDAILACYHDQGLCPLKALAFDKAVNTTIGLNVIRTSPSCGTAYDIKGKGIADPSSMIEAIKLAMELC